MSEDRASRPAEWEVDADAEVEADVDPLRAAVPFDEALAGLIAAPDPAQMRPWLQSLSNAGAADVAALMRAFEGTPEERRLRLVRALKARADDDFYVNYKPLFTALLDDPAPGVRVAAIAGLWEATEPRLLDRYAAMLAGDPDPDVRAAAAEAIGPYIERAELDVLERDRVAPALGLVLAAAADPQAPLALRTSAVASAGWSESDAAAAVVTDALRSGAPPLVAAGLVAVGRSADDRWAAVVLTHLEDAEPAVQAAAAFAAGALGLRSAVVPLARVAQDAPARVRRAAIEALGEIGGYRAVLALEMLAESETDEALAEAIDIAIEAAALGEIDTGLGTGDASGGGDEGDGDDIVDWLRAHGAAEELDGWLVDDDDLDGDDDEDDVVLAGADDGDAAAWSDDDDDLIDRDAWAWDDDDGGAPRR